MISGFCSQALLLQGPISIRFRCHLTAPTTPLPPYLLTGAASLVFSTFLAASFNLDSSIISVVMIRT